MIKALAAVMTVFALVLGAPAASAASSSSCSSSGCSVYIDDTNPGYIQVHVTPSYLYFVVYYNGWNSAATCWAYASDPSFDKHARTAALLAALPTKGYRATFGMTFNSNALCTSTSASWYR